MPQEAEVDRSLIKVAALGLISVAAAFLFGYGLNNFLASGGLITLLFVPAAAIFFLTLFLFQILFIKSISIVAVITFVESLFILIAFYYSFSLWLILGLLLFFILLISAYQQGVAEIKNSFKIRFFHFSQPALSRASTAIAVLVTLVYLSGLNLQDPAAIKNSVSGLIKPMEPIIARMSGQIISGLMPKNIGLPFKPSQLFSSGEFIEFISQSVGATTAALPPVYKNLILFAIGLAVFLTIKGLFKILNYLVSLAAFVIFQFLRAVGFFHITLESRSKEVLIL